MSPHYGGKDTQCDLSDSRIDRGVFMNASFKVLVQVKEGPEHIAALLGHEEAHSICDANHNLAAVTRDLHDPHAQQEVGAGPLQKKAEQANGLKVSVYDVPRPCDEQ